jgi:hypothetical protein
MWTCHGCGAENKGKFCKKCGAKQGYSPRLWIASVSTVLNQIKDFFRSRRELCVFFTVYTLAFFVLNSLNELWWWTASNDHARDLALDGFIREWMRTYLLFYMAIPLIVEMVAFRWDGLRLSFFRALQLRLSALGTGLILFYLVYGGVLLRMMDRVNFLRYNDTNTENILALAVFLIVVQSLSLLAAFCLKTFIVKMLRAKTN